MYNRKPRFVANKGRKLNFCLCVFCPLWSTYTHMNSFPVFYLFAFSSETSTSTSSSMPSSPRSLSLQSPGRTRSQSPDGNRFAAGRSLASLLRSDDRNPLSDPASAAHSHAAVKLHRILVGLPGTGGRWAPLPLPLVLTVGGRHLRFADALRHMERLNISLLLGWFHRSYDLRVQPQSCCPLAPLLGSAGVVGYGAACCVDDANRRALLGLCAERPSISER